MRTKKIITSVDMAVCTNCIYSYQQPISYSDSTEGTVTICAHSKHQDHDHDFCEDGMFLVRNRRGFITTETIDELYVELISHDEYHKAVYAGAGGSYGVEE